MKTIELTDASRPLADYARELGDEVVLVTLDQQPIAMLVSLRHVDAEVQALSSNPEFQEIIEAARSEIAMGRTVTLEELKRAAAAA